MAGKTPRRPRGPTKVVHIPVFCSLGSSGSKKVSRGLNAEKHRHGLSHVTFNPHGMNVWSSRIGPLSVKDKEHVVKVAGGAPIIISVTGYHERGIREAFQHAGKSPPRIINVYVEGHRTSPRTPNDEILRMVREVLEGKA